MSLKNSVKFILITLLVISLAACSNAPESNRNHNPQGGGPPGRNAQEARPPAQGQGPRGQGPQGPGPMMDIISEATGLDIETIREQSANGATLAEIITANGGDVEEVKTKLIDAWSNMPNSSEQDIEQRVEDMLNNPLPQRNFGGGGRPDPGNNN
jgi:hypothetical protein